MLISNANLQRRIMSLIVVRTGGPIKTPFRAFKARNSTVLRQGIALAKENKAKTAGSLLAVYVASKIAPRIVAGAAEGLHRVVDVMTGRPAGGGPWAQQRAQRP